MYRTNSRNNRNSVLLELLPLIKAASAPDVPGRSDSAMDTSVLSTPAAGTLILERLPQVKARTGLSRSELYRRIAAGDFPAPIKLGDRASAWSAAEVDRWITGRIAARDARAVA